MPGAVAPALYEHWSDVMPPMFVGVSALVNAAVTPSAALTWDYDEPLPVSLVDVAWLADRVVDERRQADKTSAGKTQIRARFTEFSFSYLFGN